MKKIEIFSGRLQNLRGRNCDGEETRAGSEHEVLVHDMHVAAIATRAAQHGISSVPAVVINGKLAGCCAGRGLQENVLREALQ